MGVKLLAATFLIFLSGTSPKSAVRPEWLTTAWWILLAIFVLGAVIILFLYAFNILKFRDEPDVDEIIDELRARRRAMREAREGRKRSRARQWAENLLDDEEGLTRETPEEEAAKTITPEKFYYLKADVNRTNPLTADDVKAVAKQSKIKFQFVDEDGNDYQPA